MLIEVESNPTSWTMTGNMIPLAIGHPTSTTPFTPTNMTVTVLSSETIDGNTLIPIQLEYDAP